MKIVLRQRPLERSAPYAARHDRRSLSVCCPNCQTFVHVAADDQEQAPEHTCMVCGTEIEGRMARSYYCSPACNARAYRRRKRGVPQDAFPNGGSRGSLRLDALTPAEQLAAATMERPL